MALFLASLFEVRTWFRSRLQDLLLHMQLRQGWPQAEGTDLTQPGPVLMVDSRIYNF
jgi:hypothetical protein